jgi:hypothetical protein
MRIMDKIFLSVFPALYSDSLNGKKLKYMKKLIRLHVSFHRRQYGRILNASFSCKVEYSE